MRYQHIYDNINQKILSKLKEGELVWRKSWKQGLPANYSSKRRYNGINFLSLSYNDYPSPFYLTYKQCTELNASVTKGSKGSLIIFWKIIEKEAGDEIRRIPLLRYSYVFNLAQTSLYDKSKDDKLKKISCEGILFNIKNELIIKNNISDCYYSPSKDIISLPAISDFDSPEEYYSSLFHEVIHWTGHSSRLDRFSKISKAEEELVAEIGSSYLCALAGIEPKVIDNKSAYISTWLQYCQNERLLFTKSAEYAKNSIDHILQDRTVNPGIRLYCRKRLFSSKRSGL